MMAEHVNITMKKMNPFALPVSNLSRLNLPTGGGSNAILRNNAIQLTENQAYYQSILATLLALFAQSPNSTKPDTSSITNNIEENISFFGWGSGDFAKYRDKDLQPSPETGANMDEEGAGIHFGGWDESFVYALSGLSDLMTDTMEKVGLVNFLLLVMVISLLFSISAVGFIFLCSCLLKCDERSDSDSSSSQSDSENVEDCQASESICTESPADSDSEAKIQYKKKLQEIFTRTKVTFKQEKKSPKPTRQSFVRLPKKNVETEKSCDTEIAVAGQNYARNLREIQNPRMQEESKAKPSAERNNTNHASCPNTQPIVEPLKIIKNEMQSDAKISTQV